jgi:subtilisin family serine protease
MDRAAAECYDFVIETAGFPPGHSIPVDVDRGVPRGACQGTIGGNPRADVMRRSLPRRANRRAPSPVLRHEPLEQRICLSADTSAAATILLDWRGSQVEARRDAWIVKAAAQATALGVDATWRATSLGEGFFALAAPGAGVQDVLGWAARTPGVAYVEPDFVIASSRVPNDPSFTQLWGLNNTGQSGGVVDSDIDAPEAWDVTTGSRSVVVAVIDTGIDYTHPDLAANAWRNPGEVAGDRIDNDGNGFVDDVYGWDFANNDANPMDDEGHGTHVAGTIGAVGDNGSGVIGVNWQVSIMGLKFLGADGSGTTSAAIAAVNYATRMRRDFGINVVATNNSWGGGGFSTALRDAIAAGGNAGILFVAAAGNAATNNDTAPEYPASYTGDTVISVAATDRFNRLSSFSNYGATTVDLGAPGSSIYSTVPGNAYATYSGTSMATPQVTGAVALLAAARPGSTAAEIRAAIMATTTPVAALAGKTVTGGLLNVDAAVRRLTATNPPPPPPPSPTGPYESNDSIATATAVALSSGAGTYSAVIGDGTYGSADVDLFAVQVAAGASLTVDINARSLASPSTLDSFVRLFDASGRQLASNDDGSGSFDSLLSFTPSTTGTYYVGVSSYGNSSYNPLAAGSATAGSTTGTYAVVFTVAAPVTPLTADVVDVSPDPRTTAVDAITITFNRAVTGFDLADLRLVRSGSSVSLRGTALASADGGRTWTLSGLAAATTSAGTYTLTLTASGSGIIDTAGLALSASASDSWATNASSVGDVGDTMALAQTVALVSGEVRISGRVGDGVWTGRDVDIFAVTLAGGQTIVLDVDARVLSGGSTLDSYLRVFDASGRQLAANDDAGGSYDSLITFTPVTAGTYYVGVSGYRNSAYNPATAGSGRTGSTGVYQLAMRTTVAARPSAAGLVSVLGFRDEPAAVPTATFAALGSGPAALPAAGRVVARKR